MTDTKTTRHVIRRFAWEQDARDFIASLPPRTAILERDWNPAGKRKPWVVRARIDVGAQ
jgi:hypothetical protein